MGTVVGVSLGTDAIRAAEVRPGRGVHVRACTAVGTPAGAEDWDGEIAVLAGTLRAVWSAGRFRTKAVVPVLDGRHATIRLGEFPDLSQRDLRRAACLDVEELLTYPIEEALVNVLPVDTTVGPDEDADAPALRRHLVVAVRRDVVARLRDVAAAAGLRIAGVDLSPLALARALPPLPPADAATAPTSGPRSELLVDLAADATHLVVRVGDRARFVRVLPSSEDDETALLASELEMQLSSIASFRGEQAAPESGMSLWHPVIVGIRSTIDYYQSLPANPIITRALISGTSPSRASTAESLASLFGLEIGYASPLGWHADLPPSAGFESAVGAAMAAAGGPGTLDLRTEEDLLALQRRRRTLVSVGVAGALGLVLTLDGLGRVGNADELASEAAALESQAAATSAAVAAAAQDTTGTASLEAEVAGAEAQLTAALADDVDVVELIDRIAASIPDHTALTSLGIATSSGSDATATGATASLASVELAGDAPDYAGVADWLTGVGDLPFLAGWWVTNSSSGSAESGGESGDRTSFSASAEVVTDPGTSRLEWYLGEVEPGAEG
jgi:type IV pilus assembly protein PilM